MNLFLSSMGAAMASPKPSPSASFSRKAAVWQVLLCIGLPAVLCGVLFYARHDRSSPITVASSPPTALPGLLWDVPYIERDAQGRYMVAGWVADRFGARPTFMSAIGVFLLGSLGCALSTSLSHKPKN